MSHTSDLSSLASRIGPPTSPPPFKTYFRNRVWKRESDGQSPPRSSLADRLEPDPSSLLRRVESGNTPDTLVPPSNRLSLAERLTSPTDCKDSVGERDYFAENSENPHQVRSHLGQAEAFIVSAIQEGETVRAGSSTSEASVNDLLVNVHDVDSDEERHTAAKKDDIVDCQDKQSKSATSHNVSTMKTTELDSKSVPLDVAESGQSGSNKLLAEMSSLDECLKKENTERTSARKLEIANSVELPAERMQTNNSIPSDSVRSQPDNSKGLSDGTTSSFKGFQDYARPEARPLFTPTDRKSPPSPNNSILEETKRLLIPVITENARLRNPNANIEMVKTKIMSMVTDDQCLEFVKLAKDINGQMRDRQRQKVARAESEMSANHMSVESSEEDVKISVKRTRESSDTATGTAPKAFRYAGRGLTEPQPLTPTDVSVKVQRTPKAPRAMLAREERYKAQDLLRFVETEINPRRVSRRWSSPGAQHTTSSHAIHPLPPTHVMGISFSTGPSPRTSPTTVRTHGDDRSGGLQLELTSETPVLEIQPVNAPEPESVAMDVVQLPKAESLEPMDVVQETTLAEMLPPAIAKHEASEITPSHDTAGTTSDQQPTETVTTPQATEAKQDDDSISSTPEPSSRMVVDVPPAQSTLEPANLENSMVLEVGLKDEPMPLAVGSPMPESKVQQNSNPEDNRSPETAAAPLVPQAQPHDQTLVEEHVEEQSSESTGPVPPSVPPEDPVPGLWFAGVGQSRPNVYDIQFNVSEENAAAIKRWSERNITFCPGVRHVYIHLLSLPVSEVTKMNEELEPTATPEDILAKLQAIPPSWPAPGKLIVQLDTDSTTPAVWYPGREDLKDTPIDLSPHIRPGRNSARVIQLSDASDYFFVLCAGIPSDNELRRYALASR